MDIKLVYSKLGSNFIIFNLIPDGFNLDVTYSNSSCNGQGMVRIDGAPNSAQFPNTEDCGPLVNVTASSYLGTPHYSCNTTQTFKFPNLFIKPSTSGLGFAGCDIDTEPKPSINQLPQIPPENKFFIFVDRRQAAASATVVFGEPHLCSPQTVFIFGPLPNTPITYFDLCGRYTISAETSFPVKANCTIGSDEYPIPNWRIHQHENNGTCTIAPL